jgi:hypothetical protein
MVERASNIAKHSVVNEEAEEGRLLDNVNLKTIILLYQYLKIRLLQVLN